MPLARGLHNGPLCYRSRCINWHPQRPAAHLRRAALSGETGFWTNIYRQTSHTGEYTPMATATKGKKKSKIQLQPLGDRVVVEREESQETTAGGIVLPDSAKDKPARGTIVALGTGRLLDDGSRAEFQVQVGDRVLFSQYAPETIKFGEDELLLMREEDILAVIEG